MIEDGLNRSLGEKVHEYWRLLWEKFGVTKQDQLKTILEEDLYLDKDNDEKITTE